MQCLAAQIKLLIIGGKQMGPCYRLTADYKVFDLHHTYIHT